MIACFAVLLVACDPSAGSSGSDPSAADTVEVRLTCDTDDPEAPCVFEPAEVTVAPGDTVQWVNADATFHTVTSSDEFDVRIPNGLFDVVLDEAGESYRHIFPDAGVFAYYCQPHSEFMAGTVHVVPR